MATEIARTWGIGHRGVLVVYSPLDKEVWVSCGKFNATTGLDLAFFKRDFAQRMSSEGRPGELYSALNSSLQDADRILVASPVYANQIARRHATHTEQPAPHGHTAAGFLASQVVPPVLIALVILVLISRTLNKNQTRRVKLDPNMHHSHTTAGLDADVDRIVRLMATSDGEVVRPKTSQVPMAEFQKRSSASTARTTTKKAAFLSDQGASSTSPESRYDQPSREPDHASIFQNAIDSSAARARTEARQVAAERAVEAANEPAASSEPVAAPPAEPADYSNVYADSGNGLQVLRAATPPPFESAVKAPSGSSAASDAFNKSFGLDLGNPGMSTLSASAQADINCPKCAEPKSRDFSFCLKCGHTF